MDEGEVLRQTVIAPLEKRSTPFTRSHPDQVHTVRLIPRETDEARAKRARSGGVLGSTVDKELMRLKHLLNRAVSWGYLKRTARRGHGFGGHDVDAQFEFKY